jgi:outer membrane cobalamin receptor
MKKILILLIISVLTSCQVSNTSQSQNIKLKTSLSLLDRLRSLPGLRISGFDERNAEIYLRGQTSVKYYKEVLFFVNGNRVGNYSSAYQLLQPDNIDSIKLLKSSSELNVYGADGRDGVILIKTKN